jgi:myo-inositol-1(or 4)-monophosphatase
LDDALSHRYDTARQLVHSAGELAGEYFARVADLQVHSKGAQDMVTEADLEVELLLKRELKTRFPDDAFLGEETGASDLEDAKGIWVVDPIDGTQPFVSGMVAWCVSLAYVRDGILEFGLVCNPPLGELFEGGRGAPATLNGRPISPHPGRAMSDGIVGVGYSPRIGAADIVPVMDRLLRQGGMYFRNGSGALSLCYVACGRLLGYIEPHSRAHRRQAAPRDRWANAEDRAAGLPRGPHRVSSTARGPAGPRTARGTIRALRRRRGLSAAAARRAAIGTDANLDSVVVLFKVFS